jgi:predicted RNA-binding Zn ribbon-like protein
MEAVEHTFMETDLVAGNLALDLVNTVTARNGSPLDWLAGFGAVADWAARSGAFEAAELKRLARLAAADPAKTASALRRLRDLRESLHAVASARASGEAPPSAPLARLERHWKDATGAATLAPLLGLPAWTLEASGLDLVRHRVAWEAVELLRHLDPSRLRVCDGPDCGWLFLDSSKNNRRRWCDMKDCGNVAKARRHLAKVRALT